MTAYGFRVFAIKVYQGRTQKAQKLGDVGSKGAHLELKRSLEDIQGDLLFGAARYANVPEDLDEDGLARDSTVAKKHPYVRVFEVTEASGLLSVTAEYGREGDYEILMARDSSESTTLEGQAPGRRYRMWFKMPAVGDTGILVVETRGRTHPGEVLIHWLRVLNQRAAVSFPHDQRNEEEWDRWDTSAATDLDRLDDIWAKTANHKITLRQHNVGADNNRTDNPLRLTADALPVSKLDDVKAIVGGWWKNRAKGDKLEARHNAARKLGALILPKKVLDELSFDDGEVSFQENGKVQTLSPQKIDRLWVYPLGESYPQEDQILDAARPVVDRIAKALKIEVSI